MRPDAIPTVPSDQWVTLAGSGPDCGTYGADRSSDECAKHDDTVIGVLGVTAILVVVLGAAIWWWLRRRYSR